MAVKKKTDATAYEVIEEDYSLNDVVLRGRVSQEAVEKELPSGEKITVLAHAISLPKFGKSRPLQPANDLQGLSVNSKNDGELSLTPLPIHRE